MSELLLKFKLRKKAKILFSFFSLLSFGTYAQDLSLKQAYEFMLEIGRKLNLKAI